MKKEEILEYFNELWEIEARLITTYLEHINNAVFLSKMNPDVREEVERIITALRLITEENKNSYIELIEKIKKEATDDF